MTAENQQQNKMVAVYGRVSTSNQEDQKTIEAQLSEVREFAKKNNYTIVAQYLDEGWSGDILARPELDKLRNDARNKIWQAVLVYDPDRLGRQLFYQQIIIDELKQLDVEVLFVTMPPIKNSSDELMFGVRGLFAQYEKAKITERFRIGKVNRVNNGHILATEAPYGYTYILNKGKRGNSDYISGHYEINEDEAKIVKDIFSWVGDDGLTLRGLVKKLQDLEIKPRKSKRGVWSTSTLSTLLRNKTYIGEGHYGSTYAVVPANPIKKEGYRKVKKTSRRTRPESEWIKIPVPKLIDQDLFNRAGQRLKSNFLLSVRNTKNEYLLAGKIWCDCGQRRAGEGPQKGKHLYYRCTDRVHSYPLLPECKEGGINARIADKLVWDGISGLMTSPDLLAKQVERWMNNKRNNSKAIADDIEPLTKELLRLKEEERRYGKAYGSGIFTLEQLQEHAEPIKAKIVNLEIRIMEAQGVKKQVEASTLPTKNEIETFVQEVVKSIADLNFSAKKAIVLSTVDKVVGNKEKLLISGYIPVTENINVFTSYRNRRPAKRRKINAI